jgi:hypothetical protein
MLIKQTATRPRPLLSIAVGIGRLQMPEMHQAERADSIAADEADGRSPTSGHACRFNSRAARLGRQDSPFSPSEIEILWGQPLFLASPTGAGWCPDIQCSNAPRSHRPTLATSCRCGRYAPPGRRAATSRWVTILQTGRLCSRRCFPISSAGAMIRTGRSQPPTLATTDAR